MTRLEQLHQFLEEDPKDPFNLYALGIEYLKSNPFKAKELFDRLLSEHPLYIPTYYHAGKLYLDLDQKERALQIFEYGIQKAHEQNELKSMRELKAAFDEEVNS